MEVAAYLTERAHSVSVVELEEVPFKKFFGERVGRAVMKVTLLSCLGSGGFGGRVGSAHFPYFIYCRLLLIDKSVVTAVTGMNKRAVSSLSWSIHCRALSSGHVWGMEVVPTPFAGWTGGTPEGEQGRGSGTPGGRRFGGPDVPALSCVTPPDV